MWAFQQRHAAFFDGPSRKMVMERRVIFRQLLRQAPVGTDAGKNLPVLHLSSHDSASNAFAAKSLDELGKSPRESQCTVVPRDSISEKASSLIAATTTS